MTSFSKFISPPVSCYRSFFSNEYSLPERIFFFFLINDERKGVKLILRCLESFKFSTHFEDYLVSWIKARLFLSSPSTETLQSYNTVPCDYHLTAKPVSLDFEKIKAAISDYNNYPASLFRQFIFFHDSPKVNKWWCGHWSDGNITVDKYASKPFKCTEEKILGVKTSLLLISRLSSFQGNKGVLLSLY